MHRLPLISAFVDPFDLLHWLSPPARRHPSTHGKTVPERRRPFDGTEERIPSRWN